MTTKRATIITLAIELNEINDNSIVNNQRYSKLQVRLRLQQQRQQQQQDHDEDNYEDNDDENPLLSIMTFSLLVAQAKINSC